MRIAYYVAYMNYSGAGFCEVIRDKEIKNIDDIINIKKAIEKDKNLREVMIINFIRLKEPSKSKDIICEEKE